MLKKSQIYFYSIVLSSMITLCMFLFTNFLKNAYNLSYTITLNTENIKEYTLIDTIINTKNIKEYDIKKNAVIEKSNEAEINFGFTNFNKMAADYDLLLNSKNICKRDKNEMSRVPTTIAHKTSLNMNLIFMTEGKAKKCKIEIDKILDEFNYLTALLIEQYSLNKDSYVNPPLRLFLDLFEDKDKERKIFVGNSNIVIKENNIFISIIIIFFIFFLFSLYIFSNLKKRFFSKSN